MSKYLFTVDAEPLDSDPRKMNEVRIWIGENRGFGGVKWETWKKDGENYTVEIEPLKDNPFTEDDLNRLVYNISSEFGLDCDCKAI